MMNVLDEAANPVPLAGLGRVHFIGIGGAGMSAVARILLARSVPVSGSDARNSPVLAQLGDIGAEIFVGHEPAHVRAADTVVISTAIRADNPELAEARRRGLRILHRSEALAASMEGKRLVAVAGTHGKTTTTAMVTVMLRAAGLDPSFAIGGNVAALGVNAAHGDGGIFVAEADESDGSFLNYAPSIAIVTNVEADHLDHYGSAAAVYESFDRFVQLLPEDGLLIACADDTGALDLAGRATVLAAPPRVLTYGTSAAADLRIRPLSAAGQQSRSLLEFGGLETGAAAVSQPLTLGVPGAHNVLNAAAAFAAGLALEVPAAAAAAGLGTFSGAARRFEARGEAAGVRVFDDYAHHPTEVSAALRAARTVAGGYRVHVLFQPHLFSRTREFAELFAAALELADSVAVIDIYPAREDPIPGVSSELITSKLSAGASTGAGIAGQASAGQTYFADPGDALKVLVRRSAPGDIILTVGAGDVTQYGAELLRLLSLKSGRP